jgi:nicotinamidase-related amidase
LCLWPVHCQIGSWGAGIYHPLAEAYDEWCAATGGWIDFITKGFWPWSEHYSALRADVPDPAVRATQFNAPVVEDANDADLVVWCGWPGQWAV